MKPDQTPKQKILLAMAPFWDPLIPPVGIACLKSFLQPRGYKVTTLAANIENSFLQLYDSYFEILGKSVPKERHMYLFHLGHFVLQNHMMAHFRHTDTEMYHDLVRELVWENFYFEISGEDIIAMNSVLDRFYRKLEDYFVDVIKKEDPDIFGLSVFKGNLPASLFIFKMVRRLFPHIVNIMGGCVFADHLAIDSPNFLAVSHDTEGVIDHIFIGQSELLVLKYLQGELPLQRVYTRDDIGGLALEFAEMSEPDYSDFQVETRPFMCLGATGSVSCLYQCSFCNEVKFWGKYRKKDTALTCREMWQLHQTYGFQLFFMTDSMLNPIVSSLSREFIEQDKSLYYDGYFRVDHESANIKNTLQWRRGGFYRARLGVESGSQHVLDMIGKQITPQMIAATVSALAYAGIKTTTYWVIGHPGETEEDFQQTLDLVELLKNDIWQAECAPFDYYYSGQAAENEWAKKRMLLYPDWASDMLLVQSWILDMKPSREEAYRRVFRFGQHCEKLGIPNPYTLHEVHRADERWKRLHKNAVPSILEFRNTSRYIEENKNIKHIMFAKHNNQPDGGDFGF